MPVLEPGLVSRYASRPPTAAQSLRGSEMEIFALSVLSFAEGLHYFLEPMAPRLIKIGYEYVVNGILPE
jgi:hypothetical protein